MGKIQTDSRSRVRDPPSMGTGTARYMGIALVEKNAHRHGIVNVIEILEGQLTLLTEEETGGEKKKNGS